MKRHPKILLFSAATALVAILTADASYGGPQRGKNSRGARTTTTTTNNTNTSGTLHLTGTTGGSASTSNATAAPPTSNATTNTNTSGTLHLTGTTGGSASTSNATAAPPTSNATTNTNHATTTSNATAAPPTSNATQPAPPSQATQAAGSGGSNHNVSTTSQTGSQASQPPALKRRNSSTSLEGNSQTYQPHIQHALDSLQTTGRTVPKGQGNSGGKFQNRKKDLPTHDANKNPISYDENDVNKKKPGKSRDAERLVRGKDANGNPINYNYTSDHYKTFHRLVPNGSSAKPGPSPPQPTPLRRTNSMPSSGG